MASPSSFIELYRTPPPIGGPSKGREPFEVPDSQFISSPFPQAPVTIYEDEDSPEPGSQINPIGIDTQMDAVLHAALEVAENSRSSPPLSSPPCSTPPLPDVQESRNPGRLWSTPLVASYSWRSTCA